MRTTAAFWRFFPTYAALAGLLKREPENRDSWGQLPTAAAAVEGQSRTVRGQLFKQPSPRFYVFCQCVVTFQGQ
jgi:hypothetical protein